MLGCKQRRGIKELLLLLTVAAVLVPSLCFSSSIINAKDDGYRGIWYMNQSTVDEYVYKYSGGLGTYCAKHKPFSVYCDKVKKTFFCYGGTTKTSNTHLWS